MTPKIRIFSGVLAVCAVLVSTHAVSEEEAYQEETCQTETIQYDTAETQEQCRQRAEQGDMIAQLYLGVMYGNGIGTKQDLAKAAKWYQSAAEQGHPKAQYYLGIAYEEGRGIAQDDGEAIKWYKKAAKSEFSDAQFKLGLMTSEGRGVARNDAEAVKWFRSAAEYGNTSAQNHLGMMYAIGRGVVHDSNTARDWFLKAAEDGDAITLGSLWQELIKSAEQGNVEAQAIVGVILIDNHDGSEPSEEDLRIYELLYAEGRGIKQDNAEAIKWFKKAAEQGFVPAEFNYGFLYPWMNRGSKEDAISEMESLKWIKKAAEQGSAEAQKHLGLIYYGGYSGVKKDYTESLKWYKKAAEQGVAEAQYNVGSMYAEGKGVAIDKAEAVKWMIEASEQHHKKAEGFLEYRWKELGCYSIPGRNIRPPFYDRDDGTLCFVVQPMSEPSDNQQNGLTFYYISKHKKTPQIAEIYNEKINRLQSYYITPYGKVVDVFQLPNSNEIYVIHSLKIASQNVEQNTSGEMFSVHVLDPSLSYFSLLERFTTWYGSGYSWQSDGNRIVYRFPYQTRHSIQKADSAPEDLSYKPLKYSRIVPVTVKTDSYTYEEPSLKNKTKTILKKRERMIVSKYSGGWCRVVENCMVVDCKNKKMEHRWMLCDGLKFDKESNKIEKFLRLLNISG
jgi:TPR repeat protein